MKLFALFLLLFSFSVVADDDAGWESMGTENGISIFRKNIPGSDVIALRGSGVIDAPVWKVASILLDMKRASEWVDSLEESRALRILNPMTYVEYDHIGTPFIMKDRDFVSQVDLEVKPSTKEFALLYKPIDDPAAPNTGYIRGRMEEGIFRVTSIEPGKRSKLTAQLHADPKGNVPKWIVNLFQKDWPRNTFESIRKQAAKSDIVVPVDFEKVIDRLKDY